MNTPNYCLDLDKTVEWFKELKSLGCGEDILDCLDFDSDQYPDYEVLKKAREIVYE